MQRIEITRREYAKQWGVTLPSEESVGATLYDIYGNPVIEYVFVDEQFVQAEVDWLERLYSLPSTQ